MKLPILFCLLSFIGFEIHAQNFYFKHAEQKLIVNGDTSLNGFFGGINYPRAANIDLNFDGIQDLFIFDKLDRKVLTFIGNGDTKNPKFTYAPEYEELFPELTHFATLIDYNDDGKLDIFTGSGIGGVFVYENIGSSNRLKFRQVEVFKDTFELYYYDEDLGFKVNIYVNSTDVSVIQDIDQDGDVDLLSFDSGGGDVVFYSNQSQERYGNNSKLEFLVKTYCWGMFEEGKNSNELRHKTTCALDGKKRALHSGSNMLVFDRDDDGDLDLALSDISSKGVSLLINGKEDKSWRKDTMTSINGNFPSESRAIDIDIFPAMFYLDLDFDGVKDLYVVPGPSSDEGYTPQQSWYYKNRGKNTKPVFDFIQDDFLQGEGIDLGLSAYPALFDEDGDGDLDLIVAGPKPNSKADTGYYRLVLYKNIGTKTKPLFEKTDDDYLNLFARKELHAAPTFGDIDNDGKTDLVISVRDDRKGSLLFYKNSASSNQKANFSLVSSKLGNIETTLISAPFVYDMDGDSYQDLLIGTDSGFVDYWKGDAKGEFTFQTNSLGNVYVSLKLGTQYIGGEATPFVGDVDNDGKPEMLVGNDIGEIFFYDDIDLANTTFKRREGVFYNSISKDTLDKTFGSNSAPILGDINGDSLMDLFVGTRRGGVHFYQADTVIINGVSQAFGQRALNLYPNPASGSFVVERINGQQGKAKLLISNTLGQTVHQQIMLARVARVETHTWPKGLYHVSVIDSRNRRATIPIIVE